jgi:hypothetical protein
MDIRSICWSGSSQKEVLSGFIFLAEPAAFAGANLVKFRSEKGPECFKGAAYFGVGVISGVGVGVASGVGVIAGVGVGVASGVGVIGGVGVAAGS